MTCITVEGFDHMSSPALMAAKLWDWVPDPINFWRMDFPSGRVTGRCMRIGDNIGQYGSMTMQMAKVLSTNYTQFVCGFALRIDRAPHLGGTPPIVWRFSNPSNGSVLDIRVTSDERLALYTGGGGLIAQTAVGVFTYNAWHFVEVKAVINGASSTVAAQVDGGLVITSTPTNLGTTGVHFIGPFSVWNGSDTWEPTLGNYLSFDDMYFFDTSAAPNNDFVGDVRVETIYPNAAGTHNDWTPDSGTNWQRVSEHTSAPYPDDDSSYVRANTPGYLDSYNFNDLSIISGTIYAVQTNVYARKEDTALHKIDVLVRSGGSDYLGPDHTVASGYTDFTDMYETDPATAAAWTIAGVNAAEFGQKLVV